MAVHTESPKRDWTEDSGLNERLSEWVEDIEDIMLGPLIMVAKAIKSTHLMCWLSDEVKSVVRTKELHKSEDYEDVLKCLLAWAKPRTNEFMSFSSLRTLWQGEMTFSAFEAQARRLVQECQYPVGGDRQLWHYSDRSQVYDCIQESSQQRKRCNSKWGLGNIQEISNSRF